MTDELDYPLLPLRDVVVFPHMVIPLFVGRTESIKALEAAMDDDKQIFLIAQKDPNVDAPALDDLHTVGTLATVLQMLRLPDGTVKVLVEGVDRARITNMRQESEYFISTIELLDEEQAVGQPEVQALMRSMFSRFKY